MKRFAVVVVAVAVLVSGVRAQDPARLFKAAMNTEMVDGDLRAAIEQYKKVADGSDRALAAQALLRMAECYQKLGDPQARTVYERIARDFSDLPAAAETRMRLNASRPSGAVTAGASTPRRASSVLMSLPWQKEPYSRVSSTGRFMAHVDWDESGDLFVMDLTDGRSRRVTDAAPLKNSEWAEPANLSRDERYLAYVWRTRQGQYELRVADLSTSGLPHTRVLLTRPSPIAAHGWTPDGSRIVAQLELPDRSKQIAAVSVSTGDVRVLKTVDWRGPSGVSVSPDGRYIGFSLAASDATEQADIYMLALDGSRETAVVSHPAHDQLLGWLPDGRQVLFTSDRGGKTSLWSAAIGEGRPSAPRLVMPDTGTIVSRGLTSAGALFYQKRSVEAARLHTAVLDFDSDTASASTTIATGLGNAFNSGITWGAAWSPDGKALAYVPTVDGPVKMLVIRSVGSGDQRAIELQLRYLQSGLSWLPDGRRLMASGADLKGRWGIHQIDPSTGATTPLVVVPEEERTNSRFYFLGPEWAPDGRTLYFSRRVRLNPSGLSGTADQFGEAWFALDVANGTERELFRAPAFSGYGGRTLISPDGRTLLVRVTTAGNKGTAVMLVPTDGSAARELTAVVRPSSAGPMMWAPDGRSVLIKKHAGSGRYETWRYRLDGQAHRLKTTIFDHPDGVGSDVIGLASLSPNGKQVVFTEVEPSGGGDDGLYVLERFID